MDFKAIYAVVDDDFEAVNQFISHHLDSNVPLIREVGDYIIQSGGKRLRPLIAVLCARASGYQGAATWMWRRLSSFCTPPPYFMMT